jgi:hypothetical protein
MRISSLYLLPGLLLIQSVSAEDVNLIFAVSADATDPVTSELIIEIDNTGTEEIWNVDVRLEQRFAGLCADVFQLGRIPAGTIKRIRSTCMELEAEAVELLFWRIDFDADTGHQQILTTGTDISANDAGGQ